MALWDDIEGYYRMEDNTDEIDGDDLDVLDGQITFAAGLINNAGVFDSTHSMYVTNSNANNYWKMGNTAMTLNFWLYKTSDANRCIMHKRASGTGWYIMEWGGNLYLQSSGGLSLSTADIPTSTWTMITVTYDGANTELFVDGVSKDSAATAAESGNCDVAVGDGTAIGEANWDGKIDEIGIWTSELSQANITALYNGGSGEPYPSGPDFTKMQINIGDSWKSLAGMQINIGDVWKEISGAQINIGDAWKTIF